MYVSVRTAELTLSFNSEWWWELKLFLMLWVQMVFLSSWIVWQFFVRQQKLISSERVERSTNHSAGILRLMVERHSQVALWWSFQSTLFKLTPSIHKLLLLLLWGLSQSELTRAEIIQSKWMMGMKWAHFMEESKLFSKFIEHFAQSSFKFKINFISIFSIRCNIYNVNTLFQSFFAPSSFLYLPICQPLTS